MVRPDDPSPPSAPVPWWKRPVVWLVAIGGVLAGLFAALSRPTKPLVFTRPAPPPPPPPPPDVPLVKIPQVDDKPASTYEAEKVAPTSTASAVNDAEVDAALARLNAQGEAKS
jgi:hypothetical protein